MFCPNCGSKMPEGTLFCGECGSKMNASAAKPTTQGALDPSYTEPVIPAAAPVADPAPAADPAPQGSLDPAYVEPVIPEPVPVSPVAEPAVPAPVKKKKKISSSAVGATPPDPGGDGS